MPALSCPPPPPLCLGPLRIFPPLLQAPLAGFSNSPFRQAVREFGGAGLLFTEMISADSFTHLLDGPRGAPNRLWGVKEEPRPLGVQIWDEDEAVLAEVGRRLAGEFRVSVVDLNFGCPARRVTRAESGSYLLDSPARLGRLVAAVVKACAPTPVTAKIRLGRTAERITAPEVARAVEEAGAAGLTVHGRTADAFFKGRASWERIAELKGRLIRLPLIGNGDVDSPEMAVAAFRQFGVDGVMIGRAALRKPWLFREIAAALRGTPPPPQPSLEEQGALLVRQQDWLAARFGEEQGAVLMRRFACVLAHGWPGAVEFRRRVNLCRGRNEFRELVARYYSDERRGRGGMEEHSDRRARA